MLIEGNALKIRTIRSILVKSGDIGQNFRTLSFSERCFDTQTKIGIEGVLTEAVSWSCTGNPEKGVCGSQVDLLTVRKDRVTNPVCRCFLLFWGSHFIPASGVHNPWNVKTAGGSEETIMPAVIMSY